MTAVWIQGAYCPACGNEAMMVQADKDGGDGSITCTATLCSRPDAAQKVLGDPEIHHIVRFGEESGTFNAKHPLRERVASSLLDCDIHEEIHRWIIDGGSSEGTWRIKRRDDVPGEESNEWPWLWEKL